MQIKQQALTQQLQKKIAPLYLLIGQDNYLLDEALFTIKSAIRNSYDCDEKIISIQSSEDWSTVIEEANNYPLFSDKVMLNIYFDKKTLDAAGKKHLIKYLTSVNPRSFIIIKAPNLPAKQIQWLSAEEHVVVVLSYPLNSNAIKIWIINQLKVNSINYDPTIPDLIFQYTQGNMLACAQVIEKIALSNAPNSQISAQQALEHLSDQCEHSLFELIDACLMGQADKAIHILRQAANNKSEATLVLWMLTQEIRILLQLNHLAQQHIDLKTASNQLKIWPQRLSLYQMSLNRLDISVLRQLLHYCRAIDEQIKSSSNARSWSSFENLALSICLGRPIGDVCAA